MTEVRDELEQIEADPTSADLDRVFRLCHSSRHWNGPMPMPFPVSEIAAAAKVAGVRSPARLAEVVDTVQAMDERWRSSLSERRDVEGADADS